MPTRTKQRINITLPPETIELIDRVSEGSRSEFIDKAVRVYINRLERARLKRALKHAYRERAKEDLEVAHEWEPIEREVWEMLEEQEQT
ncbi:MAG: ribbon-helix-helix domain-containing protein [Candidatus Bipolaricaulia bacterium]